MARKGRLRRFETGSFFVGLQCERFILSPNGEIAADRLRLLR
jgi:hypothetical protein